MYTVKDEISHSQLIFTANAIIPLGRKLYLHIRVDRFSKA